MSSVKFQDFGLYPEIQKKLSDMGFETPTEIQEKAIPILMGADRIDFHGQAQTGTGKTLAFGIPLLQRVDRSRREPQALVIAPTRELAVQIGESLRPLTDTVGISLGIIYGGVSMDAQLQLLRRGAHIIIGTPGRLNDHIRRNSLKLDNIKTLVLDEADIMLDMGFKDEIDEILNDLPEQREIWLFSATVKSGIHGILKSHMKDAQSVRVSKSQVAALSTRHQFCVIPMNSRLNALCRFIESNSDFYGFIFCQTKMLTAHIAEQLLVKGYRVGALHGDMSQSQRNSIMRRFQNKDLTILVATDVAARGIDVKDLTHVINYSFPDDQESYIHRAGRTGRAGREGIAITFVNNHEVRAIRGLQQKFGVTCEQIQVPDRAAMLAVRLAEAAKYVAQIVERGQQAAAKAAVCEDVVKDLTPEQCKSFLVQLLYDKFVKSIDEGDQSFDHKQASFAHAGGDLGDAGDRNPQTEITLNVGSDDNVQREDITAVLETKNIPLDSVTKVRILRRCTFLHINPAQVDACAEALNNTIIGGRKVRATVVGAASSSRDRDHSGGRSGGGRRGGSYRGGERSGGERSSRPSYGHGERTYGERSSGERPSYGGERSHHGGDRSSSYERPSYGDRASSGDRSYGNRSEGGRRDRNSSRRSSSSRGSGNDVRSWRSEDSV